MPRFRTILLVAVLASPVLLGGCQWLILSGLMGGGYAAGGPQMTDDYTQMAGADGAAHVGAAVTTWRERDQLPMPKLAEGPHVFAIAMAPGKVLVKGSLGARKVQLLDNGDAVAEYVVAWDKQPYEYRLVSARNLLYDAPLDVSEAPTLPTYNLNLR